MNEPLLVIIGETASGKSSLALKLAKNLNGEIICADSWTVRREVNIGTDKPTLKDRQLVTHHLLDVAAPDEDFTAAVFKNLAKKAIVDIHKRGKLPIMVGGTGLYIDSVLYDYSFLQSGNRHAREELNKLTLDGLMDIIKKAKIPLGEVDIRNKRRLIRLIETDGQVPEKSGLRQNTLIIGVRRPEEELKDNIQKRVDRMIDLGLEQEVRDLSLEYGWDCEALKGVGYKQWQGYFSGSQSLDETKLQIISATSNLAKKQRTWFRRNKSIHWLTQPIKVADIVELVTTELSV
jgi:tRNA dimethylallyltransferase